jgi:hypothetical protein
MRVYAMGHAPLEEVLATAPALTNPLAGAPIARDGDAKPEEKKKRGRPRKVDTAALLPMAAAETSSENAEEAAEEVGEDVAEEVSVVAA